MVEGVVCSGREAERLDDQDDHAGEENAEAAASIGEVREESTIHSQRFEISYRSSFPQTALSEPVTAESHL